MNQSMTYDDKASIQVMFDNLRKKKKNQKIRRKEMNNISKSFRIIL